MRAPLRTGLAGLAVAMPLTIVAGAALLAAACGGGDKTPAAETPSVETAPPTVEPVAEPARPTPEPPAPEPPGAPPLEEETAAPVRRLPTEASEAIGAVEGKPTFDAPPPFTLDTSNNYEAILELEEGGTVRIQLFGDIAPVHVNNFVFLVDQEYYDNLTFHRVVSDFVAQTGDPTATSTGSAGYVLPDEEVAGNAAALTLGDTGIIAMARSGAGASSSQFFITLSPQGQLSDLGFTAFGKVIEGMELIQALPARDPQELPQPPAGARIKSIRIDVTEATASADASTPAAPEP